MKKRIVLIPITMNNIKNINTLIRNIFQYLPCKKIVFVGRNDLYKLIPKREKIEFVDEDILYTGLNFSAVKLELIAICSEGERAGWYFQQFLKMAYALVTSEDAYIVWDADSIPLNHIDYWNEIGQYYFTIKTEHHQPYFDTIAKLFPGILLKSSEQSYIAEQMIIKTKIMRNLINDIGNKDGLFWKRILRSCDSSDIKLSGFSEFETYGNYVMTSEQYSQQYVTRTLRCCRKGGSFVGCHPNDKLLAWASRDLDMISIESSVDPKGLPSLFFHLSKIELFRKCVSYKKCMYIRKYLSRGWRFIRNDKQYYIEFD